MLRNTFCHIPGIGAKSERQLWAAGVRSWQDLAHGADLPLSPAATQRAVEWAAESERRLAGNDCAYFGEHLAACDEWRMFAEFRHTVAYLDIETTGLGGVNDYITTIALYDGREIFHYVQGRNLGDFARDISRYSLLVTYNGKSFDVPFIRNDLGLEMGQAHIDLRYVLASVGYRGGLKGCERQLGLDRGSLADVDGFFAVLLWFDYIRNRNARALETLLAYNMLDVVNLATLMVLAYNLHLKATPFAQTHRLPVPVPPKVPFEPDQATIDRIKREHGW